MRRRTVIASAGLLGALGVVPGAARAQLAPDPQNTLLMDLKQGH